MVFVDNTAETSTLVKALIVEAPVQVINPTPRVHEFKEIVVPENGLIVFASSVPILTATVVEFNVNVVPLCVAIVLTERTPEISTFVKELIVDAPVQLILPEDMTQELIVTVVPECGLIVFTVSVPSISSVPVPVKSTFVAFNVNVLPLCVAMVLTERTPETSTFVK